MFLQVPYGPLYISLGFQTFAFVPAPGLVIQDPEHFGLGIPEEDLDAVVGQPRVAGVEDPAELLLLLGIGFGLHAFEDLPRNVHGEFSVGNLDVALGRGDGSSLPELHDASALVPLLHTEVLHLSDLGLREYGAVLADSLAIHHAASADPGAAFHVPFEGQLAVHSELLAGLVEEEQHDLGAAGDHAVVVVLRVFLPEELNGVAVETEGTVVGGVPDVLGRFLGPVTHDEVPLGTSADDGVRPARFHRGHYRGGADASADDEVLPTVGKVVSVSVGSPDADGIARFELVELLGVGTDPLNADGFDLSRGREGHWDLLHTGAPDHDELSGFRLERGLEGDGLGVVVVFGD